MSARNLAKIASSINDDGSLKDNGLIDISHSVTTYDSYGSLPREGLSAGQQALTEDTNTLFITDGNVWFRTAIVNQTPQITSILNDSGLSSPFTLTPNVNTNITITVNDDGPVSYTYTTTDSATDLSVITNDSDGVFTFTPQSLSNILAAGYDSNGGEFTVIFKASDGISFGADSATFSVSYVNRVSFDVASTVNVISTSNITNSGEQGIEVTQDGYYLLQADNLANIHIWTMSTAYDVSTAGYQQTDQYTGIGTPYNDDFIGGIRVSADMSQAFIANWSYARMIRFGQEVSNIDYPGHVSQTPNQTQEGFNIYLWLNTNNNFWDIAKDGSAFFAVKSNERLQIHKMNTPYDLTSFAGNPEGNVDLLTFSGVPSNSWNVTAVAVNDDGTRFWVGTNQNNIYQFDLSTANDYTTMTYTGAYANGSSVAGLAYANGYLYVEQNGDIKQLGN